MCSRHDSFYYRPYPKDGEGNVFTGICLFTPRWGGGVHRSQVLFQVSGPRSFHEIPQSHGLCQISGPRSFLGRGIQTWLGHTPVPGGGTPVPVVGTPGLRYPSIEDRTGVPPARTGLGYPPSPARTAESEYLLCCDKKNAVAIVLCVQSFTISQHL